MCKGHRSTGEWGTEGSGQFPHTGTPGSQVGCTEFTRKGVVAANGPDIQIVERSKGPGYLERYTLPLAEGAWVFESSSGMLK